MKLMILTSVSSYENEILKLLKAANIEAFSSSEIDGYKTNNQLIATQSWFPMTAGGSESLLFFSFTKTEQLNKVIDLVKDFNSNQAENNPIRLAVLPVETYV